MLIAISSCSDPDLKMYLKHAPPSQSILFGLICKELQCIPKYQMAVIWKPL